MTPTMKLRWVKRSDWDPVMEELIHETVLQQWWEAVPHWDYNPIGDNRGEWRDVPTEAEDVQGK